LSGISPGGLNSVAGADDGSEDVVGVFVCVVGLGVLGDEV
jgi:hypothetical protein